MASEPIFESNPDILGGAPVFAGTRVPIATLTDYLEEGAGIGEFLADFPSVPRQLVLRYLEASRESLLARAD